MNRLFIKETPQAHRHKKISASKTVRGPGRGRGQVQYVQGPGFTPLHKIIIIIRRCKFVVHEFEKLWRTQEDTSP